MDLLAFGGCLCPASLLFASCPRSLAVSNDRFLWFLTVTGLSPEVPPFFGYFD